MKMMAVVEIYSENLDTRMLNRKDCRVLVLVRAQNPRLNTEVHSQPPVNFQRRALPNKCFNLGYSLDNPLLHVPHVLRNRTPQSH